MSWYIVFLVNELNAFRQKTCCLVSLKYTVREAFEELGVTID